jgi:hypothetical protein
MLPLSTYLFSHWSIPLINIRATWSVRCHLFHPLNSQKRPVRKVKTVIVWDPMNHSNDLKVSSYSFKIRILFKILYKITKVNCSNISMRSNISYSNNPLQSIYPACNSGHLFVECKYLTLSHVCNFMHLSADMCISWPGYIYRSVHLLLTIFDHYCVTCVHSRDDILMCHVSLV